MKIKIYNELNSFYFNYRDIVLQQAIKNIVMENVWEIFICYRQVDGQETALWVYHNLNDKELPVKINGETIKLKVYWDAAAPALSNWQELHKPALESSRALIVICTPGLYAKLNSKDWVHMELEWWLKNRKTAPLIIDPTGEGERWLPEHIKKKWPYAQRLTIDLKEWNTLPLEKRSEVQQRTIKRILEGISESETKTRFEDLEQKMKLVRRLRVALIAVAITALLPIAAFFVVREQKHVGDILLAQSTLEQARQAILRNDMITALALSIRAVNYSQTPEITEKYLVIQNWAVGELSAAEKHLEKVMNYEYERAIDINLLPLQVDRLSQNASLRSAFEDWILLTGQTGEQAYDAVLLFKGLISRIETINRKLLLERAKKTSSFTPQLQFKEAQLAKFINSGVQSTEYYKEIKELVDLHRERLRSLGISHDVLKQELTFSWSQVQERLNAGEMVLDFLKYHDRYAVWILKKEGFPIRVELGKANEIESLLDENYNPIVKDAPLSYTHRGLQPAKIYRTLSKEVDSLIWRPIRKHLADEDSVLYIVPDGVFAKIQFGSIPLSTFTNNATQKNKPKLDSILFDKKTIAYLSTVQELTDESYPAIQGRRMLLVGGSDFETPITITDTTRLKNRQFNSLIYTQEEVESIAAISRTYPTEPISILTGVNATEGRFREFAPGSQVIHISTIGWAASNPGKFNSDSLLRKRKNENIVDGFLISIDPTIRTGLAFAGISYVSKTGMNDGLVTAFEIAGLKLDSTVLVVLSACNTIGQVFAGNGVQGFVSSFRKAGVKNIVATLSITYDSQETVNFFNTFYYYFISKRMSPARALREAILESRSKGVSAEVWAPYVCYGPVR